MSNFSFISSTENTVTAAYKVVKVLPENFTPKILTHSQIDIACPTLCRSVGQATICPKLVSRHCHDLIT